MAVCQQQQSGKKKEKGTKKREENMRGMRKKYISIRREKIEEFS